MERTEACCESFYQLPIGHPRPRKLTVCFESVSAFRERTIRYAPDLFHLAVDDLIKQRHAVSLCPQPDVSGFTEG
jgi:hypothetical protein